MISLSRIREAIEFLSVDEDITFWQADNAYFLRVSKSREIGTPLITIFISNMRNEPHQQIQKCFTETQLENMLSYEIREMMKKVWL